LHLEGFQEVEYVEPQHGLDDLAADRADLTIDDALGALSVLDAGKPLVMIAGIHAGCFELFGSRRVRGIRDLKGKSVAVYRLNGGSHLIVASMLAYVGMNPDDVHWVPGAGNAARLFVDGKVDAFIGFPPDPQELRAQGVGHVILDTSQDRPWSQYFCCMLAANRRFVEKNPIATKRVLRALLKAIDMCDRDPALAARYMVKRGHEPRYKVAYEILTQISYRHWREASPEDTLRFYALRLHEVGMLKTSPNKLVTQGADWRFLNELKRELKG
jgi:NitT/TauT family transport system substrate-binding protein